MMVLLRTTGLLILGLVIGDVVQAQVLCTEKFSVQVLDEQRNPLIGASVYLESRQQGKQTDASGIFVFESLCRGNYTVTIRYVGYKTLVLEVTLPALQQKIIQLEPDVKKLQEVVVHDKAEHVEHSQNFTQLTETQLAESAGKSLGESLKDIPGVNTIQSGPGIFKPVIHGVHSQRILILNHGIRQEGQQWGAEHAPEIDPFIAAAIIVVKDASSIKYGTDALGGVIIVNPSPLPETAGLGGSFNLIGQHNGRSGTLSGLLEGGIKKHDGWGWRLQGSAKQAGDFHTPDYVLTNTGVKELNFSTSAGYHDEHAGFEVFFSRFQTELGILKGTSINTRDDLEIAMEREPPQFTAPFSYTISAPRQEVSHNLIKINGHRKMQRGELRLQYGFQNNNRKEFDIRKGDRSNKPSINLQLNTHTLETEWESQKAEKRSTCIGITGMFQNNKNVFGTDRLPFIPNFSNASGGVFAITKFYLTKWTIDVGTRYDYRRFSVNGRDYKNALYNADFHFQNISFTAGSTLQLTDKRSLSINLSSSWRPPHVAELYSSGTHQSAAAIEYGLLLNDSTTEVMKLDDVSFKNEQALKLVSTYRHEWMNFDINVSGYANYIFNYIYLKPSGVTKDLRGTYPYLRYTQTDALFMGLDISASWRLHRRLKVMPQVSLLRASDERNSDYLVFIPANWYSVSLRYEKPGFYSFANFYVETKLKYVARQKRAPRVLTATEINEAEKQNRNIFDDDASNFDFAPAPDGYALLNLSTGLSFKAGKMRYDFRLAADNILNTEYREYTNRFRYYADDLGRNFVISLKCIF
jgi:iron complex outermembrane receptor protein